MDGNKKRRIWILALTAVLVVSCTCSLLPSGINLPQSMAVGNYITVYYPEEWFGVTDFGVGVFSPEYLDLEADDSETNQPFFIVMPLELYLGPDWFSEITDPQALLEEIASDFLEVSFRSTTTVELGNLRWSRGSFLGPLGEFPGTWEGWLAIELLPRGGAVVWAAAPESQWGDVDNIFDAMLRGLDFAD